MVLFCLSQTLRLAHGLANNDSKVFIYLYLVQPSVHYRSSSAYIKVARVQSNLSDACFSDSKNIQFFNFYKYYKITTRYIRRAVILQIQCLLWKRDNILCVSAEDDIFTNFKLICMLLMQEGVPLITHRLLRICNLIRHNLRLTIYQYHLLRWARIRALLYITRKNEGKHVA